jgi:hypothetical protein
LLGALRRLFSLLSNIRHHFTYLHLLVFPVEDGEEHSVSVALYLHGSLIGLDLKKHFPLLDFLAHLFMPPDDA